MTSRPGLLRITRRRPGRIRERVAPRHAARSLLLATVCLAAAPAVTQAPAADAEMSPISGPPDSPRRHFRLRRTARLTAEQAQDIYARVASAMARGYAVSGLPEARAYLGWARHNRRPYRSSSHGNHYLNNYANEAARGYGCAEDAGTMPEGSVIAKDSFSVTRSGEILLGPLFLMEKMPAGFRYVSGDWRYTMVMPDGTLFGRTGGPNADRVEYCISCHLAVEQQDHLYFVPGEHRADTC